MHVNGFITMRNVNRSYLPTHKQTQIFCLSLIVVTTKCINKYICVCIYITFIFAYSYFLHVFVIIIIMALRVNVTLICYLLFTVNCSVVGYFAKFYGTPVESYQLLDSINNNKYFCAFRM